MSRGRPSKYTEALANEICERLSKGEPLAVICRDERMPGYRTVYDWMEGKPAFSASIARAREEGFDIIASDCLSIADSSPYADDGPVVVARDKLKVETRLKLLAKWDPKRYGERIVQEHVGAVPTVAREPLTEDEWAKKHGQ